MNRLLHRGGKFTTLDALWLSFLVIATSLIAWSRQLNAFETVFIVFALLIALIVPLGLKTGFTHRRSNLDSPYERALRRLLILEPVARITAILGIAIIALNFKSRGWFLLALAIVFIAHVAEFGIRFIRARRGYRAWLQRFLDENTPAFALTTPRTDGGSYQIGMWLEPVSHFGRNFVIIVRTHDALPQLEAITDRPVLVCESWADLDQVMGDNIRAVFYVNSVGANADLLTYRTAKHVYIGHGDSEKPLSVHPLHAAFDYIAVAGQAAIDRYAKAGLEIPEGKFIQVGRPQLTNGAQLAPALIDVVTPTRPLIVTESGSIEYERTDEKTILYAPTWKGYNELSSYSSLALGKELVTRLIAAGYRAVFRPHPFSLARPGERELCQEITQILETDNSRNKPRHMFGPKLDAINFSDLMHVSDALIADRSSVVIDYLATGKPIAEIEFPAGALDTQSESDTKFAYPINRTLENLEPTLSEMLGTDPLREDRYRATAYYLGGPSHGPNSRFTAKLEFLFN